MNFPKCRPHLGNLEISVLNVLQNYINEIISHGWWNKYGIEVVIYLPCLLEHPVRKK